MIKYSLLFVLFAVSAIATPVKIQSANGSIYLRPAGLAADKKTALIVFMHGWGSSPGECERVFAPLVEAWGCSIYYPCGGHKLGVFTNRVAAYTWDAAQDVTRVVKEIGALPGVDANRIFVTGFSSGAAMCYRIMFESPGLPAGVIPFSGALPQEFVSRQVKGAPPVFIVHGTKDGAVNVGSAKAAETQLKAKGVPVKLHMYDGSHFFPDDVFDVMREAIEWFGTAKVSR